MRAACAALVVLALARPALAGDPASTLGLGARPAALGGAGGALADPSTAGFSNPASAALGTGLTLGLGYAYAHPVLEYDGEVADVEDVHGLTLCAAVPLLDRVVKGRRLRAALGLGLFVPDRWLARVYLIEPTRPSFVMWEGPVSRMVATPVLALAAGDLVSLGVGATLLADGAAAASLHLGFEGSQTRTDAEVDIEMRLRAAPVAGIILSPLPWLTLAGGYTGELAMDIRLDVDALVTSPVLEGTTVVSIRGTNDYTPATAWAAVAIHPAGFLDVHLEGRYVMWHRANPFHARLRMVLDLGGAPATLGGLVPTGRLEDRWVLSTGIEGRVGLPRSFLVALRAGYQYRPTPVPVQTGWTCYADSDVHLWSTGLGFSTPVDRPVRISASWALELQRLVPRSVEKDPDVFLSTGFRIEGWVVATMLELTLGF